VDEKVLETPLASFPVLGKTVIAIHEVGTIIVEPQIKNRNALVARRQQVNDELKAALEAAGVHDLTSAPYVRDAIH
jgi:acid stress-induced BolA-like protein IbaG/YrbA